MSQHEPTREFLVSLTQVLMDAGLDRPPKKTSVRSLDWEWQNAHNFNTPIKIIGMGNDKIVVTHTAYPDWVFKLPKHWSLQVGNGGYEAGVWQKLQGTAFEPMLAPIIEYDDVKVYAMKKGTGRGDVQELETHLWNMASETHKGSSPRKVQKAYNNLVYYLLDDATDANMRQIDGRTVLIDYDVWSEPFRTYFGEYMPKTNPKRRRNTRRQNQLVPKEQVRMKGFDKKKAKVVEKEIPYVLGFIEQMRQEPLMFPTPIRAMTQQEFQRGRNIVDNGHPMGAGHGQINMDTFDIAINPAMNVFDLVTNVFHENLHYAFPDWPEEDIRDTTGLAMQNLYGQYNLGRPFAEEQKRNPQDYFMDHRPASPEYGGPLHDLTQVYPDDIYGPNGRRYYGTGMGDDTKEWQVVQRAKGKPDAPVRIYRSIPASVRANQQKIFKGDWVALNINYVIEHAEGGFGDDGDEYLVLSALVPASTLWTEGNSIQEWGYWPKEGSVSAQLGYAGPDTKFSVLSPKQIQKFVRQSR